VGGKVVKRDFCGFGKLEKAITRLNNRHKFLSAWWDNFLEAFSNVKISRKIHKLNHSNEGFGECYNLPSRFLTQRAFYGNLHENPVKSRRFPVCLGSIPGTWDNPKEN
jgi:hypothetical protein